MRLPFALVHTSRRHQEYQTTYSRRQNQYPLVVTKKTFRWRHFPRHSVATFHSAAECAMFVTWGALLSFTEGPRRRQRVAHLVGEGRTLRRNSARSRRPGSWRPRTTTDKRPVEPGTANAKRAVAFAVRREHDNKYEDLTSTSSKRVRRILSAVLPNNYAMFQTYTQPLRKRRSTTLNRRQVFSLLEEVSGTCFFPRIFGRR